MNNKSKIAPIFHGTVIRGKVNLEDRQSYVVWLAGLEGNEIDLIVRRRQKVRTKAQNRYLHGVCYAIIAEHSGYETTDEVHEAMREMFLKVQREDLPPTLRSTTDLTTVEFSEYIENIKRWAANFLGLFIPDAGDVYQ